MKNKSKLSDPRLLRKEVARITASRDNNKAKNRAKARTIKEYQDTLREVKESRKKWKTLRKENNQKVDVLKIQLQEKDKLLSEARQEINQILTQHQEFQKKMSL